MLRATISAAARIARLVPSRYASEAVRATWKFAPRPKGPFVVDCDGSQVEVDPAVRGSFDTAVYYHRTYEMGLLDIIARHVPDGLTMVDVGAYTGLITLHMTQRAKIVHAFEPHPDTAEALERNLARNDIGNVEVHRLALGSEPGTAELYDHPDHAGANTLHTVDGASHRVEVAALDSFTLDPAFIKIDVEGWESEVLKGAVETIKRARPVLSVESSKLAEGDRAEAEETYQLIRGFGYDVFVLSRGKDVPSPLRPVRDVSELPRHDNLICFP